MLAVCHPTIPFLSNKRLESMIDGHIQWLEFTSQTTWYNCYVCSGTVDVFLHSRLLLRSHRVENQKRFLLEKSTSSCSEAFVRPGLHNLRIHSALLVADDNNSSWQSFSPFEDHHRFELPACSSARKCNGEVCSWPVVATATVFTPFSATDLLAGMSNDIGTSYMLMMLSLASSFPSPSSFSYLLLNKVLMTSNLFSQSSGSFCPTVVRARTEKLFRFIN